MRSLRFMPVTFAASVSLAAMALAGCSSHKEPDETPSETPTPAPVLTPQVVPTASADGTPLTPGRWKVGTGPEGGKATYAEAGNAPAAILACDRNSAVLSLTIAAKGPAPAVYRLESGAMKVGLSMAPVANAQGMVSAAVDKSQPIFATLLDTSNTLEITGPGAALRLPGNPGIRRVITACS